MCGIAGKVSPGRRADRELVERMCDALVHRGPDSAGLHVDGEVALGMRRLAIIDLAGGDQPLYGEDRRTVLVLNGEIYNHRELRAELRERGHRFQGGSDAEVVVHLWEELGPRCLSRLRGMFALALWDERERRLFLARDRLGKKPLYWALRDGALAFASEPRALLQDPALPRDVDLRALDAYLSGQYVPHGMCAFRALHKLPPASALSWRPGEEPRVERWWELSYGPKERLGLADAAERVRELVLEATRLRLESDVPLGAFLSGGVDSSAVVAAMALSSAEPVRTFSAAFDGERYDESGWARRVAERYGTDHTELHVGPVDTELLTRIARRLGEPLADPAAIPTFQLSELTRRDVTVALSGDGGDESFAGYRRYLQLRRSRVADRVPRAARAAAAGALRRAARGEDGRRPLPRAARLAGRLALPPGSRFADLGRWFRADDRTRLYGPRLRPLLASDPVAHVTAAWDRRAGLGAVDRAMACDLDSYLPDALLAKADAMSMASSLELRSPLLDHELVQFAASLPEELKLRGAAGKVVLREAVRPWLPAELLDRPKHGFAVPIAGWLRGPLRALPEELLLDPAARERELFRPGEVRRLVDEHRAGADRSPQLWPMIALELWFRTCVDAAPTTAAAVPALA